MDYIPDEALINEGYRIERDDAAGKIAILKRGNDTIYYLSYYHRLDSFIYGVLGYNIKSIDQINERLYELDLNGE